MSNRYEQLKSWKALQEVLKKIPDPSLRKLYHDTFVLKAIEEWGFNPEQIKDVKQEAFSEKDLDEWEKDLIQRIKVFNEYGFDIKPKEEIEKERKEFTTYLFNFIKEGGTMVDLPEDLRSSAFVRKAYFDMLKKVYNIE